MSEITSNVEFAHKIHEQGHHHPSGTDIRERWVEILEAVVLAMVAVATAWSGYQASKWETGDEGEVASILLVISTHWILTFPRA